MKREFRFSEEFGKIDERLVLEAGGEWRGPKRDILRLYSRKIACVLLILLAGVAAAGNAGVQAAAREFTTRIGEILGFRKDLSAYAELLDRAQTRNGITLTLKEVIVDDRVLMVTVQRSRNAAANTDSADTEKDGGEAGGDFPAVWINEEKTTINGQRHLSYESLSSSGVNWNTLEEEPELVLVETYEDQVLPEGNVEVHLVLEAGEQAPRPWEELENKAEFVYDFFITPEEAKAQTVKQTLDVTVEAGGGIRKDLILTELTMNDLYCRIKGTGVTWDDAWPNQYDLKLKGTDSFGNQVSFDCAFLSEKELVFTTSFFGDYENTSVSAEDFRLSIPDKNCEYLKLQLYEREIEWGSEAEETGDGDVIIQEGLPEVVSDWYGQENPGWEPVGEPFRIAIR